MHKAAFVVLFLSVAASAAEPGYPKLCDRDRKAYETAYYAVETGRAFYNAGRTQECIRYFAKTLNDLKPWMEQGLATATDNSLRDARAQTCEHKKAYILRYAVDRVMYTIVKVEQPAPGTTPPPATGTGTVTFTLNLTLTAPAPESGSKNSPLWDSFGGVTQVAKFVADFIDAVASDDELKPILKDKDGNPFTSLQKNALANQIFALIQSNASGMNKNIWKELKTTNPKLQVSDNQFDLLKAKFKAALKARKDIKDPTKDLDPKDQEDLIAIFESMRSEITKTK